MCLAQVKHVHGDAPGTSPHMNPQPESARGPRDSQAGPPKVIELHDLEVRGNRVRCGYTLTGNLERYLRKGPLEMNYDVPVGEIDDSISYVPFVASVLPLAFLAGADISVRTIDAEYLRSVMLVQDQLKAWRPGVPFRTKIMAGEGKANSFAVGGRGGLLFSGGLDSTASYLLHKDSISTLIMVGGTEDMPLTDLEYWRRVRSLTSSFAAKNGASLHSVESNWLKVLKMPELMRDLSAPLVGPDHQEEIGNWEGLFRITLLGLCSPVTAAEHLQSMLIASTLPLDVTRALGRHGVIEEILRWGDLTITRDTKDFTRQQKIGEVIAPYLDGNQEQIPLRVCHPIRYEKNKRLRRKGMLNCSDCEKCYRTILGLVLDGVNPPRCGFERGSFDSKKVRQQIVDRKLLFTNATLALWTEIKQHVNDRPVQAVESNVWDCNDFFDWLATYDLSQNLLTSGASGEGKTPP